MTEVKRSQVFISYSHRDRRWLEKLQTILAPLVRDEVISLWDDTSIRPGTKWRSAIETALSRATVAVLLVSDSFLASDFIATNELPALLKKAEENGLNVFWVPVGACLYQKSPIAEYQAAHDPSHPLDTLRAPEAKRRLVAIAAKIAAAAAPHPEATPSGNADPPALWCDCILGYAYYFDNDGWKEFGLLDIAQNWKSAYRRFSEGEIETDRAISLLVSYLPSETTQEGNVEPDFCNWELALDQLVAVNYVTRRSTPMGDRYTISDAGRAHFSRSRNRIISSLKR